MELLTGIAVTVGAGLAVAFAPATLSAVGFTVTGIAAKSLAAGMMSSAATASGGGVLAGSIVAVLQSAGAAGLAGSTTAVVAGVGGAVGGAVGWLTATAAGLIT
ncbi:interferon alpha-inducible protein 27-like protein 2A isoform X1 [Oncorhynchus masou masou]|uniref:interferon alpha-inducible protein 27-like protein 2A isoform X1 n=1 Tax=Oncorhynchus masou masou TaxID=90313 RepID=UPI003183D11E